MKCLSVFLGVCITCASLLGSQAYEGQPPAYGEDTPLLIYFRSQESLSTCADFDQLFNQPDTKQRIEERYVIVCLNTGEDAAQACAKIYHITEFPALVVADQSGAVLYRTTSVLTSEDISRILSPVPSWVSEPKASIDQGTTVQIKYDQPVVKLASLTAASFTNTIKFDPATSRLTDALSQSPDPTSLRTHWFSQYNTREYSDEPGTSNEPVTDVATDINHLSATPGTVIAANSRSGRKWSYAIQLGFFSTDQNASRLIDKASAGGLTDVRTEPLTKDGQTYFRVLSGTYHSLSSAQAELATAVDKGFNAAIYRWE